jgi:hypothetical protein
MIRRVLLAAAMTGVLVVADAASAQNLTYARGQNISPAYEGWEEDSAGRRFFVFGYMNRNWGRELDVPVGADNKFTTGTPDRDNPPTSCRAAIASSSACRCRPLHREGRAHLVTDHEGKTEMAYASTRIDYKIDDVVRASRPARSAPGQQSRSALQHRRCSKCRPAPRRDQGRRGGSLTAMVRDDGLPSCVSSARRRRGGTKGRRLRLVEIRPC